MFFRYIKDFFEYYFYQNKYRKQNFYVNILSRIYLKFKNASPINTSSAIELSQWVNEFSKFKKIIICASGPSLNNLKDFSEQNLYITTNSSVSKVLNFHFIYFTFTREYINLFLRRGFKEKGWEGTIFRFTQSKANHVIRMNSYKKVLDYLSKYHRNKTELLLSDIQKETLEESNFYELNQFIKSNLNFNFDNENSGISILLLGYYFAKRLNKPLEVYGLDAGSNGYQYFNNSGKPDKEISNNRTLKSLPHILNEIEQDSSVQFENHSFFKPKV